MVAVAGLGSIHHFSSSVPKLSRKLVHGQRDKVICFPSAISEPENSSTYICRWLGPRLVGCGLRLPIRKSRKVNLCSYSEGETVGSVLKLQEFKDQAEEGHKPATSGSTRHSILTLNQRTDGKSGFLSFYGPFRKIIKDKDFNFVSTEGKNASLIWLFGPITLVASVVLPPFFLRKLFEAYFEDSLLTDFLILFFTEALFYSGVALFLLVTHHVKNSHFLQSQQKHAYVSTLKGYRVLSIGTFLISVLLPLISLGLAWPWTGPAASAAVTPYLVGLLVQFAFEQFVQYKRSPVWPIVPAVFQVYRLHQLNRATQLIAGLMFSLRGADASQQALAINSSLQSLLNVLQVLGIICLWSMATFITKLFPYYPETLSH